MRPFLCLAASLAFASACDDVLTAPTGGTSLVIQAFLYAGEPVTNVHITTTVPVGSTDTVGAPVNDAVVSLTKSGVRYTLSRTPGDTGFYRYTGTDLTVTEGDVFDLTVSRGSTVATARTIVPTKPGNLVLTSDSVIVPSFGGPGGPGGPPRFGDPLVVRWPKVANALFYVTVETMEASPQAISTGLPAGLGGPARRFIFAPVAADSFAVTPLSFSYLGRHLLRVYHVNDEYAALYESRQQDTRDLNEPATNIKNALGVFSAFSSRTAVVRVVQ